MDSHYRQLMTLVLGNVTHFPTKYYILYYGHGEEMGLAFSFRSQGYNSFDSWEEIGFGVEGKGNKKKVGREGTATVWAREYGGNHQPT